MESVWKWLAEFARVARFKRDAWNTRYGIGSTTECGAAVVNVSGAAF